MKALAFHLFSRYGFKYVLPGKFASDPIKGRFGWYRQVNGGSLYVSILQLFQTEKMIPCLSLPCQKALHKLSSLNITQSIITDTCRESTEGHT